MLFNHSSDMLEYIMVDISNKRILCLSGKHFTKFCIVLTFLIASVRIGLLGIPNWYYQGRGLKKWKGGLFSVTSSGGLIKEHSYSKLSEHYCAEKTNYPYSYSDFNITYYEADSMCRKFQHLSGSSGFFVAFSVITFIVNAFRVLPLVMKVSKPFELVIVPSFFHIVLEFVSVIVVAAAPKITFADDCHYLSYFTESTADLNTCGDTGASVSLFINLVSVLVDLFVIILFFVYKSCGQEILIQARESGDRVAYQVPPIIPEDDPACKVRAIENVD